MNDYKIILDVPSEAKSIFKTISEVRYREWIENKHNLKYIFLAMEQSLASDLPPPRWAVEYVRDSLRRYFDPGYKRSLDEAFKASRKQIKAQVNERTVATLVAEAKEAGLKGDKALELAQFEYRYFFRVLPKGKTKTKEFTVETIRDYYKRHKKNLSVGFDIIFFNSIVLPRGTKEYFLGMSMPQAKTECIYLRYKLYDELSKQGLSDNEIISKVTLATADVLYKFGKNYKV